MAKVTLKGEAFSIVGDLPEVGSMAPDFSLVKQDLSEVSRSDFAGKKVVMNIFPSVDTPVCATSVRTFNKDLAEKDNVVILCISADLPFAAQRFCGAEGLENVCTLSDFRDRSFGHNYGIHIADGPLKGLLSRAVLVLDEEGTVLHRELVPEIASEPNYAAVMEVLG